MGRYVIKAFGVTKDIVGGRETTLEAETDSVAGLRAALVEQYPSLGRIRSLMIAVNSKYAEDDLIIGEADEIALIPPVSGG